MADLQRWWWLGVIVLFGTLLYLLAPVLTPFLIAATLAYLGDPLADWLETKKLSRTLAVCVVFVALSLVGFLFILMMIPMLKQQVELVANKSPVVIAFVQTDLIPWITEKVGTDPSAFEMESVEQALKEQLKDNSGIIASVVKSITSSGLALVGWVGNLVLIPVVGFYLLRDWDILVEKVFGLFPRHVEPVIKKLAGECDEVLSAFVRGQLMVMVALGFIYAIGLYIVGLDLALLVGMIAGLASIVPYLGFIIGIVFAVIAALIQYGDPSILIWIALVFAIGQMLEGMVLTPLLVGDKIGLHPVAVIFAVLAGGQLFGFIGVLIALPVAAVIMVLLRHVHDRYINSVLYGVGEVISEHAESLQETISEQLTDVEFEATNTDKAKESKQKNSTSTQSKSDNSNTD